jgi:hypothetical protein
MILCGGGVTILLFFFIKRPADKDIHCEDRSPEGISGVTLLLTIALSTILVRWHVFHHDPQIASQVGKLSIGKRKGRHRIGFWHFQLPWHGSGLPACGMCLSYRTYRSELRSFRLCISAVDRSLWGQVSKVIDCSLALPSNFFTFLFPVFLRIIVIDFHLLQIFRIKLQNFLT